MTHFTAALLPPGMGTDGESSGADNQLPSVFFLHPGEPRIWVEGACLLFLAVVGPALFLPPPHAFVFQFSVYSGSLT